MTCNCDQEKKDEAPEGFISFLRGHMSAYSPDSVEREKIQEFIEWVISQEKGGASP